MMLVHMEVHLKGYFLMRIQFEFEAWCNVKNSTLTTATTAATTTTSSDITSNFIHVKGSS